MAQTKRAHFIEALAPCPCCGLRRLATALWRLRPAVAFSGICVCESELCVRVLRVAVCVCVMVCVQDGS